MLGLTIRMKKKMRFIPPPSSPGTCNHFYVTLLQRSSVYTVVCLLTEKQADRQLFFGAYFSKNNGQL